MDHQQYFDSNKKFWDSRVEPHQKSELYKMEAFMIGETSLTEIERDALGDVNGKSLLKDPSSCLFGIKAVNYN